MGPESYTERVSATAPIRVAIAEDDYLVREGAAAVLASSPAIDIVAAVADPPSLRAAVAAHDPDVVILDIRMPPTHTDEGIRLAHELRDQRPATGIVVLSQHAEVEHLADLLGEGTGPPLAYILKERLGNLGQLVHVIRTVHSGGSVLDPELVDGLLRRQQARSDPALATLTPREHDVLALMAGGYTNAVIADKLGLSIRSVEKHVNSIFSKLGLTAAVDVNRRVAAVLLYLRRRGHL